MIRGVIFDMDGLMFDTERLAIDIWQEVGRQTGREITRGLLDRMIGRNSRDCRAIFAGAFGESFDYDAAIAAFSRLREAYFRQNGVPVKPGLVELLGWLKGNGYAVALATSTSERTAREMLAMAGVDGYFDRLVFGDQVARGKPEPDIFLTAAAALGLPPEMCMVLEDSAAGITAAHRAGCAPVMVPDLRQPSPELEALLAARCETLRDVIGLLEPVSRVSD